MTKIEAVATSAQAIVTATASVLGLISGGGLTAIGAAAVAGTAIRLALSYSLMRAWLGIGIGSSWQPSLLKKSAPYFLTTLTATAYGGIDVLIIGLLGSTALVGNYIAASRPMLIIAFLINYVGVAALPAAVRRFKSGRVQFLRLVDSASASLLLVGAATSIVLVSLAQPLVALVYGPDFQAAVGIFRLCALYLPAVAANAVLGMMLTAAGRQRDRAAALLAGLGATAVLCFLLIPPLQSTGAALQLIASELVLLGYLRHRVRALAVGLTRPLRHLDTGLLVLGAIACAGIASTLVL
jgi:O-antigen/teichoic acid export membrane protein